MWEKLTDNVTDPTNPLSAFISSRLVSNTIYNSEGRLKRHTVWFPCWGSGEAVLANFQPGDLTGKLSDEIEACPESVGLSIASPVQRPVALPIVFPLSARANSIRATVCAIATIAGGGTARVDCKAVLAVANDLLPAPMVETDLVTETGALSPDFKKFANPDFTVTATPIATGEARQFHRVEIPCDTRRDDCVRVRSDEVQSPAVLMLNFLSRVSNPAASGTSTTLSSQTTLPGISWGHGGHSGIYPFRAFRYDAAAGLSTPGTDFRVTNEIAHYSDLNGRGLFWPPVVRAIPGSINPAFRYDVSAVRIYSVTIEELP